MQHIAYNYGGTMKVLILNSGGSDSAINSSVQNLKNTLSSKGAETTELVLRDMKYSPCRDASTAG